MHFVTPASRTVVHASVYGRGGVPLSDIHGIFDEV